ncbi:HD-GYP domain-containing protein [Heliophilum fasciatum]|uniref:HD domain-containing protein n=1 Tax=Heliophilum fasciatum TaxID=35700 RepID=A0A4R2RSH5_9FIRM|nr:HD-GYP domain-containing protein [Heliophilum fasciatum]MCW2277353.1 HD-GYP domain-containing protein (c-di-GMP phosphodiesterase class II) [Heliophilum fasciatum]TCP67190.1 HD domain-containing protein [Heliophilum fasciatum]
MERFLPLNRSLLLLRLMVVGLVLFYALLQPLQPVGNHAMIWALIFFAYSLLAGVLWHWRIVVHRKIVLALWILDVLWLPWWIAQTGHWQSDFFLAYPLLCFGTAIYFSRWSATILVGTSFLLCLSLSGVAYGTENWQILLWRGLIFILSVYMGQVFAERFCTGHERFSFWNEGESRRNTDKINRLCLAASKKDLYWSMVQVFTATMDAKDSDTRGHSEYVRRYVQLLAKEMNLSPVEQEQVALAAILHDIGKICISQSILRKPGKLTNAEYAEIKMHVTIGEQIISKVPSLRHLTPMIAGHHEWYNGKGYPEGLKGEEIALGARIISVVDTFEAMTANRVYRKALPRAHALAELARGRGTQFDPVVVDAFLALEAKGKLDEVTMNDEEEEQMEGSVAAVD